MKVTHKLIIVFGFMASALMLVLLNNISNSIAVKQKDEQFSQLLVLSHDALSLVHELQKERGLTSAYLALPSQENHQALLAQRILTDNVSVQFYQKHNEFSQISLLEWKDFVLRFDQNIRQIYLNRQEIDQLTASFESSFTLYSHAISAVLALVGNFSSSDFAANQGKSLLAYYQLLVAKEFAGQERAFGAALIFVPETLTLDHYVQFNSVVEKQKAAYFLMTQLMDEKFHSDIEMLDTHPLSQQLKALREEIKHKINHAETNFSVTQEVWFNVCSGRINLLQGFESKVFFDLLQAARHQVNDDAKKLWMNSVFALFVLLIVIYFWFFIIRKRLIKPIESISDQLVMIIGGAQYTRRIEGDFSGEFGVMRDSINEALVRLEQSVGVLAQDKVMAERLNEAKSSFVHHITHELRTPLNAILGFTQLLQLEQECSIKGDPLDQIGTATRHLLTIINQVLDMGKIESGKLDVEHIPYVLHDVVHLVINMTRETAKQKGLILTSHIDDSLPSQLVGDPTRMRQILINLIGNAIKFTKKGSVSLSIMASTNGKIRFEVIDTGIGMTEEAQQKLFKPFSQADESISRQFGGTGLGLSLSKQLIELMDGEIGVVSQQGIGTTFWFELPLICPIYDPEQIRNESSETDLSTDAGSLSILSGKRVLLAEDNRVNQLVATKLLAKLGVEVVIANNGDEALQILAGQSQIDLMLLDIQMPIKDGYDTITEIRQKEQETGQHLCVIGLSANGMKEDTDSAVEAGMDDYMSKPIEFTLLREKLLLWLSNSKIDQK